MITQTRPRPRFEFAIAISFALAALCSLVVHAVSGTTDLVGRTKVAVEVVTTLPATLVFLSIYWFSGRTRRTYTLTRDHRWLAVLAIVIATYAIHAFFARAATAYVEPLRGEPFDMESFTWLAFGLPWWLFWPLHFSPAELSLLVPTILYWIYTRINT